MVWLIMCMPVLYRRWNWCSSCQIRSQNYCWLYHSGIDVAFPLFPLLFLLTCLHIIFNKISLLFHLLTLYLSCSCPYIHTEQAYSSDGLTNNVYACSLSEMELMFKLPNKKPKLLLALPQWYWCGFQIESTPKMNIITRTYIFDFTTWD
jgi:hypothetical protein